MEYKKSSLTLLWCIVAPALLMAQHPSLIKQWQAAIQGKKAEIGIALILNGEDTVTVNNNARYPLMSVFKFHQALALAHRMDSLGIPLDTRLTIGREQLKPDTYSPLRDKYPQGGISMSLASLMVYTLQQSDNNACDILFDYQGGPEAVDGYIRSLGIDSCAIAYNEEQMHQDVRNCYRNWSSPLAAARLLEDFLSRPLLAQPYKEFLFETMVQCKTGADRLVAPLQGREVIVGHKTGTGDRNEQGQLIGVNDIGFVLLPDGRRYTLAVFVKNAEMEMNQCSEIIAQVSRICYQYLCPLKTGSK